jgi:SAM-dependent methyltransferase
MMLSEREQSTFSYHHDELAIALEPTHPAHLMPEFLPKQRLILDVGCGMGQTLIAARALRLLPKDCRLIGVDIDESAIAIGREMAGGQSSSITRAPSRYPYPTRVLIS